MTTRTSNLRAIAIAAGYRSGLEEKVAEELTQQGVTFDYEKVKLKYLQPAKACTYTPDFRLPNGIIVETKGRFTTADRQKHLMIKEQFPHLDIRFVFSSSKGKIDKRSKNTYASWCDKYGFVYAERSIPSAWIKEKRKDDNEDLEVYSSPLLCDFAKPKARSKGH